MNNTICPELCEENFVDSVGELRKLTTNATLYKDTFPQSTIRLAIEAGLAASESSKDTAVREQKEGKVRAKGVKDTADAENRGLKYTESKGSGNATLAQLPPSKTFH